MITRIELLEQVLETATLLLEKGWTQQYGKMMELAYSRAYNHHGLNRRKALRKVIEAQQQQINILLEREAARRD